MLIGIDGNEANVEKQVGVSIYTQNLLCWFQKWAKKDLQFKVFLRRQPLSILPQETNYFKYKVIKGNLLWSQLFLPLSLYTVNKTDVFFSPAHYAPRFCPVPFVVTIHDLSYFYYPEEFLKKDLYQLKNWTKYSVEKARKVIAVSKTTKKDLIKWYGFPEEKIEVVYNGFEKNVNTRTAAKTSEVKEEPRNKIRGKLRDGRTSEVKKDKYFLFVGTLQPRKNLNVLIDAFDKFVKIHKDFKLVIAGKKGWLYEKIFQKVKDLKLEKKVVFTDHVSDQKLVNLYKNAFCLVMPSLYEGFGIPILEAISFNCPVLSSFASSLPEVGGEACLYFDPQSSNDLLDKLNQLIQNQDLRKELIMKGKERIKLFSWRHSAEQTLQIIKSLQIPNSI